MSVGSGFIAARTTIGSPFDMPASRPPARFVRREPGIDLVVRLSAAPPREREAVADLDALHGLDPHQGEREARVEPVGLLRVRAETGGTPVATTSTIPPSVSRSLRAASVASCMPSSVVSPPTSTGRPATAIPSSGEQRLRDRAGGDVDGRVPRGGSLEGVADVVVAVLEDAGEVGVPRAGQRHGLRALARPARPRAATGSSPTSSSRGRGCGRRA